MPKIFFTTHTIHVHSLDSDNRLPLIGFNYGCDVLHDFQFFLDEYQRKLAVDQQRQTAFIITSFSSTGRIIKGFIEIGDFGSTSKIWDTEKGVVTHVKKPQETSATPYYFTVIIPSNSNVGIIGLQRTGVRGIQTQMFPAFIGYFAEKHRVYRCEIRDLVPSDFIDRILKEGLIRQLRLISYRVPKDLENLYHEANREAVGSMELIIKPQRRNILPIKTRLEEFFLGTRAVTNFIEVEGFDTQEVKIDFKVDGRNQIIDISDLNRYVPSYDITSDVEIGPDGNPIFESIDKIGQEIMRNAYLGLGIRNEDVQ